MRGILFALLVSLAAYAFVAVSFGWLPKSAEGPMACLAVAAVLLAGLVTATADDAEDA